MVGKGQNAKMRPLIHFVHLLQNTDELPIPQATGAVSTQPLMECLQEVFRAVA